MTQTNRPWNFHNKFPPKKWKSRPQILDFFRPTVTTSLKTFRSSLVSMAANSLGKLLPNAFTQHFHLFNTTVPEDSVLASILFLFYKNDNFSSTLIAVTFIPVFSVQTTFNNYAGYVQIFIQRFSKHPGLGLWKSSHLYAYKTQECSLLNNYFSFPITSI